jgi:hypothetical protein
MAARERGNSLFRAGDIQAARDVYYSCLANENENPNKNPMELSKLYNNISACEKELGNEKKSMEMALRCLQSDPVHGKAHLRLAQLSESHESLVHLMAAAALLGCGNTDVKNLLSKYNLQTQNIKLASTIQSIRQHCAHSGTILIPPGRYVMTEGSPILLLPKSKVKIIGLGEVTIVKGSQNFIAAVGGAFLSVENISVVEGLDQPIGAAFSSANVGSCVELKDCRFQGGGGITVDSESRSAVFGCSFEYMTVFGIEVRNGGSVEVHNSIFNSCSRAVTAYSGGKEVVLLDCEIAGSKREALNFDGSKPAAQARAMDRQYGEQAEQVATDWHKKLHAVAVSSLDTAKGKTGGISTLRARVERCTISGSILDGVMCGDGAEVQLTACRIEKVVITAEAKHQKIPPFVMQSKSARKELDKLDLLGAVSVRGGASLLASHCAFVGNTCAVRVDINFGGEVAVEDCVFFDNRKDLGEATAPPKSTLDLWSRPARMANNRTVTQASDVPEIRALSSAAGERWVAPARTVCGPAWTISCNPSRQPFVSVLGDYYPIGNTWGVDVLSGVESCIEPGHYSVALLGCGDIRNALETVAAWWRRCGHGDDGARLSLTLNDASTSVLVRDAALLELIHRGASVESVAACWGSAALDEAAHGDMCAALRATLEGVAWLNEGAPMRERVPGWGRCVDAFTALTLSSEGLRQVLRGDVEAVRRAADLTCRVVGSEHRSEVTKYLGTLALDVCGGGSGAGCDCLRANPTLLEAPEMRRSIYFSSSIFRAVGPLQAARGRLTAALLAHLAALAGAAGAALRSGRVGVRVEPGDAFDLAVGSVGRVHDAVDTSNLADYCGLANAVLLGARLGRRVRTQSTHAPARGAAAETPRGVRAAYLEEALGVGVGELADLAMVELLEGAPPPSRFGLEPLHPAPPQYQLPFSIPAHPPCKFTPLPPKPPPSPGTRPSRCSDRRS